MMMMMMESDKYLKYVRLLQQFWQPGLQPSTSQDVKPFSSQPGYPTGGKTATAVSAIDGNLQTQPWEGRSIATQKFRLVEFSAYLDLNADDTVSDVRRGTTIGIQRPTANLRSFSLCSSITNISLYI